MSKPRKLRRSRAQQAEAAARFPTATHELTDAEIEHKFGDLIREAFAAFATDPSYLVEMMQAAAAIENQRERLAAYWNRVRAEKESA